MFRFVYQDKQIGLSALENGDPPMGCAEGVFVAEAAFLDFRAKIAPQPDDDPAIKRWVGISVRTEDGREVECLDAVLFEFDFGDHKELRVDVLDIPYPQYEKLFPGRYATYEASFGTEVSGPSRKESGFEMPGLAGAVRMVKSLIERRKS